MVLLRLQKKIAENSSFSRRKAEALITDGQVKVNGVVVTELGTKVEDSDEIEVNGKALKIQTFETLMLNKPRGLLTSRFDPHHSKNILDLLPEKYHHLKPAGRLDFESEGLLILSSDGELIQKLTHPRHGHKKIYEVLIQGTVDAKILEPLGKNFVLDGVKLNPMPYKILKENASSTWLELILSEGRNRQIRRCMAKLGFHVLRLRRTAINELTLGKLEPGAFQILGEKELSKLLDLHV